jgi:hypothetical protein
MSCGGVTKTATSQKATAPTPPTTTTTSNLLISSTRDIALTVIDGSARFSEIRQFPRLNAFAFHLHSQWGGHPVNTHFPLIATGSPHWNHCLNFCPAFQAVTAVAATVIPVARIPVAPPANADLAARTSAPVSPRATAGPPGARSPATVIVASEYAIGPTSSL